MENQRKSGTLLRTRAMQHFAEKDFKFKRSGEAIAAMRVGIEIERQADGLPSYVMEILNASEPELERMAADLDARRRAALGAHAAAALDLDEDAL